MILLAICTVLGVLIVGVLGLLWFFGIIGGSKNNSSDDIKISAKVSQNNNQTVSQITQDTVVAFAYPNTSFVSDSGKGRYFQYYNATTNGIQAGLFQFHAGKGSPTGKFRFQAYIDSSPYNTQMSMYNDGFPLAGTETKIGTSASYDVTIDLQDGETIGLLNIYTKGQSAWNAGSYYSISEK